MSNRDKIFAAAEAMNAASFPEQEVPGYLESKEPTYDEVTGLDAIDYSDEFDDLDEGPVYGGEDYDWDEER